MNTNFITSCILYLLSINKRTRLWPQDSQLLLAEEVIALANLFLNRIFLGRITKFTHLWRSFHDNNNLFDDKTLVNISLIIFHHHSFFSAFARRHQCLKCSFHRKENVFTRVMTLKKIRKYSRILYIRSNIIFLYWISNEWQFSRRVDFPPDDFIQKAYPDERSVNSIFVNSWLTSPVSWDLSLGHIEVEKKIWNFHSYMC